MTTPSEAESAPPARRLPVLLAAASLVVGGGIGAYGVGPMLAPTTADAAAVDAEPAEGHGEAAAPLLFTLEGIIVNPAGSRGQHHLITTVAFKLSAPADEVRLRSAEVALRDAVGSLLEKKTLDQLTAPGVRDRLRAELATLVASYVTAGTLTVYLPQYIVQ